MTQSPYLARRHARLALNALKHDIVFGLVISGMLLVAGLWHYFFVVGADDRLWLMVTWAGGVGLIGTLVFPSAWGLPQKGVGAAVRAVGGALFAVVLTVVYVVLITPLGWLLRKTKGDAPIYRWIERPPGTMEGWHGKEVLFEAGQGNTGRLAGAGGFVRVIGFFAGRGHYLFLPTLVILIALGMVLFFVKTSALAPLIYTIF